MLLKAGLLVQRDDGPAIDRFRNRLMIPICRDTGSVIAFGGRALEKDQQPKYLNSPETPIYSKGRTLYGLNLSKAAIRQSGFAVLVEGYFDFAQVYQAGVPGGRVVRHGADAAAGAAAAAVLGQSRAELRPRCGGPGRGRANRVKCWWRKGFEVNVATLPAGADPDTFVQKNGGRHTVND